LQPLLEIERYSGDRNHLEPLEREFEALLRGMPAEKA
jgi:hypothetical protein